MTLPIVIKLARLVTYLKRLLHNMVLERRGLARSYDNLKTFIYNNTVLITIKLGSMMDYLEAPFAIKSHNPLITWSCEIT